MVEIRLARYGSKKTPFYRIVVTNSRSPRDGRFIETVGTWDPRRADGTLVVDRDRLGYWRGQGAALSHTLDRILRSHPAPAPAATT